jgi:hypothetical protein
MCGLEIDGNATAVCGGCVMGFAEERDEARAQLDAFMREVGAALLGPPEEGTEWGGGGILDGIRKLQAERDRLRILMQAIKDGPDRIAGCACYHIAGCALVKP